MDECLTNQEECKDDHDWHWHYDCFEDARILDCDSLGIPVKCSKCEAEGIEWYVFSNVSRD